MCVPFKAVASSMSTVAHSLLPSFNLDVPPCSSDTGLWSFKAITMALKQAVNSIHLFLKPPEKNKNPSNFSPNPSHVLPSRLQWLHPPGPRFSQPLGVKRAAWFSQASPFSGWQLRLLSTESLQAVWGWQIGPLSMDNYHVYEAKNTKQKCLL